MFCAMIVERLAGAGRRLLGRQRRPIAARTSGGRSVDVLVINSTMLSRKSGSMEKYNVEARARARARVVAAMAVCVEQLQLAHIDPSGLSATSTSRAPSPEPRHSIITIWPRGCSASNAIRSARLRVPGSAYYGVQTAAGGRELPHQRPDRTARARAGHGSHQEGGRRRQRGRSVGCRATSPARSSRPRTRSSRASSAISSWSTSIRRAPARRTT